MCIHVFDSQVIFDHQQEACRRLICELFMLGFGLKAGMGVHWRKKKDRCRATKIKVGLTVKNLYQHTQKKLNGHRELWEICPRIKTIMWAFENQMRTEREREMRRLKLFFKTASIYRAAPSPGRHTNMQHKTITGPLWKQFIISVYEEKCWVISKCVILGFVGLIYTSLHQSYSLKRLHKTHMMKTIHDNEPKVFSDLDLSQLSFIHQIWHQ